MLLMFGVGLHFSLDDLLAVKRIAVPGAVVQMGRGHRCWAWRWPGGGAGAGVAGWCSGCRCRCASTVVLLKALEARGVLDSMNGRIAVGWLVVEDLAMVLVLVLLPPLAGVLGGTGAAPGGAGAAVDGPSA
jgi:CPA2 family monovalent cation:H+ antiporter-2